MAKLTISKHETIAQGLWFKERLTYDPVTGCLLWKVSVGCGGRIKPGSKAGTISSSGGRGKRYLAIRVRRIKYYGHRVVWLLVHGVWPEMWIDHINGNTLDNRIGNLRLATPTQNLINARRRSDNISGFKGVHWSVAARKWQATVKENGRAKYLGLFETAEDAHAAYLKAAYTLYGPFVRPS